MLTVVPFKVTDEADHWSSPRCALVEADNNEQAIERFVAACVYPNADSSVWGESADWGSRPERLEDGDFYIVGSDPTDPHADIDEPTTIMLSVLDGKVQAFETTDEAEEYRDELHADDWVYTSVED